VETACQTDRWRRRRGTALPEFALCIPLLALIVAATFFFGWAAKNRQRVTVADRYAAWRGVRASGVSGGQLNETFFEDRADGVDVEVEVGTARTVETIRDYVALAESFSADAGFLADELARQRWPRGWWVHVAADFPPQVEAFRHLTGAIHGQHAREGVEWRRGQADCVGVTVREYVPGLDEMLHGVPAPGTGVGQAFRQLMWVHW